MNKRNCIVVTGGPGMGKTSLIEILAERGYPCVPESGRAIIREQLAAGGRALPWIAPEDFALEMYRRALRDYEQLAEHGAPVFFDRGLPDVVGYLRLTGLPVPRVMLDSAQELRYYRQVFITPPWEAIYRNDAERKQTFAEAVHTYEVMMEVYSELDYEVVEIPRVSPVERAEFLIRHLLP